MLYSGYRPHTGSSKDTGESPESRALMWAGSGELYFKTRQDVNGWALLRPAKFGTLEHPVTHMIYLPRNAVFT